jgi:hypothetical protein
MQRQHESLAHPSLMALASRRAVLKGHLVQALTDSHSHGKGKFPDKLCFTLPFRFVLYTNIASPSSEGITSG